MIEIALEKNSTNSNALINKAEVFLKLNKQEDALFIINQALKINSTKSKRYEIKGLFLYGLKKED